jgi:branched-chain amino acid transport system substrate-binding protein
MRRWRGLLALLGALLAVVALAACGGDDDSGGNGGSADSGGSDEPIVIGLAVANSGPIAPYDVEAAEAAQLRAKQINADGGVNGRPLKMVVKDTRSDKATASNAATELISSDGAVAIIASCDFDYGSPAAIAANSAEVPGISMCASDPKFADKKTIGEYAFSMGVGSDVEGASNAEWAFNERDWKSAYILQDESIEYTKALGRYFKARWDELGGEVVGEDSFPGGENVNVRSQAAKIRSEGADADFIYLPSWNPGAATAIRQLRAAGVDTPILGPAAVDSSALDKIAGPVSDVFFSPYACYSYCTGQDEAGLNEFVTAFEKEYGKKPSSSYDLAAYDLVSAIATAAEQAEEVSGSALKDELEQLPEIDTPTGKQQFFSDTCHKPIQPTLAYVEVVEGKLRYVGSYKVEEIADVGDGNPCVTG